MERREYQRINVSAKGSFFAQDIKNVEFVANIVDVSENGVRVEIDNEKYGKLLEPLDEGHVICFQAMEEFLVYDKSKVGIFDGKAIIVRKQIEDNLIIMGCRVYPPSNSLMQYVEDRKVSVFISDIKSVTNGN